MKRIWNVWFVLVFMLCAPSASIADEIRDDFKASLEKLRDHGLRLSDIGLKMSGYDHNLWSLATDAAQSTLINFKHLSDLEILNQVVFEDKARMTLRKMLYLKRLEQRWDCRFYHNHLRVIEDGNGNPLLRAEAAALKNTLVDACNLIKPEDAP